MWVTKTFGSYGEGTKVGKEVDLELHPESRTLGFGFDSDSSRLVRMTED